MHHGSSVRMLLVAGELALLIFVVTAAVLFWAAPRVRSRLRRRRRPDA